MWIKEHEWPRNPLNCSKWSLGEPSLMGGDRVCVFAVCLAQQSWWIILYIIHGESWGQSILSSIDSFSRSRWKVFALLNFINWMGLWRRTLHLNLFYDLLYPNMNLMFELTHGIDWILICCNILWVGCYTEIDIYIVATSATFLLLGNWKYFELHSSISKHSFLFHVSNLVRRSCLGQFDISWMMSVSLSSEFLWYWHMSK